METKLLCSNKGYRLHLTSGYKLPGIYHINTDTICPLCWLVKPKGHNHSTGPTNAAPNAEYNSPRESSEQKEEIQLVS